MSDSNNSPKTTVQVITSDPHRAQREKEERERWEAAERAKIEQEIRYKASVLEEQKRQKQLIDEQQRQKQLHYDFKCPVTGMVFVLVKGGTFLMGGGGYNEMIHEVTVNSFLIGKFQVTQAEWQKVMINNPSRFKGERNPVENVSWFNTQEYIKKLNSKTGKIYRLPTEAEWEYAARSGGKKEKYAGGNNVDDVSWHYDNSGGTTHPVGQKQANGLGIYDMSGNVWEWCNDWYDENYYQNSPKNNPQGPMTGTKKVVRGGSWHGGGAWSTRATERIWGCEDSKDGNLGFRLVSSQN